MRNRPTKRQLRYAYGLLNEDKSKYQIALEAGFSPSTARIPKMIENKRTFYLAKAQIAGEAGNMAMKVLFELQARDLSKESTTDLLNAINVLSKTWQRFNQLETQSQ